MMVDVHVHMLVLVAAGMVAMCVHIFVCVCTGAIALTTRIRPVGGRIVRWK